MNQKYIGMTVNERLYVGGLMREFDTAIKKGDVKKIIAILNEVDIVDDEAVNQILQTFGLGDNYKK